jgi:hypothetical protein
MTPEEKADFLIERFMPHALNSVATPIGWVANAHALEKNAKACAILCCKEIIEQLGGIRKPEYTTFLMPKEKNKPAETKDGDEMSEYWQSVLKAIELL